MPSCHAAHQPQCQHPPRLPAPHRRKQCRVAQHQQHCNGLLPLHRVLRPFGRMHRDKQPAREQPRKPVSGAASTAPCDQHQRRRHRCQLAEVVDPPADIAAAEHTHRQRLGVVRTGHVVVGDVDIGLAAVVDQEIHIVHHGRIDHDLPVDRLVRVIHRGRRQHQRHAPAHRNNEHAITTFSGTAVQRHGGRRAHGVLPPYHFNGCPKSCIRSAW
jgi:hypothetical protein